MPISGFDSGLDALKFIVLPVVIGVVSGIGSGSRWYRTFFLEEAGKDYVRTARAKGLAESLVLFRHILRNALIPIVTGVVVPAAPAVHGQPAAGIVFCHSGAGQLYH